MDDGVDDPVAGEPSGDALGSGSAAPRLSCHLGTEWLRVGSHSARSWPLSAQGARRSGPRSPLWTSTRMTTVEEYLRTERLVLRRFTTDDADLLAELDSDPEVMRYITGGRPTPRDEIVNEVLPALLSYYDRFEGFGFWAAIERDTGQFLGWFHLRPAPGDGPAEVELGYRLRRAAWAADTRPKARGPWSRKHSTILACAGCMPRR